MEKNNDVPEDLYTRAVAAYQRAVLGWAVTAAWLVLIIILLVLDTPLRELVIKIF